MEIIETIMKMRPLRSLMPGPFRDLLTCSVCKVQPDLCSWYGR